MLGKAKSPAVAGLGVLVVLGGLSLVSSSASVDIAADETGTHESVEKELLLEGKDSTESANRQRYVAATNDLVTCAQRLGHDAGSEEQYGLLILYSEDITAFDGCETETIFKIRQKYEEWYIDPQGRGDVVRFECLQRELSSISRTPYTAALMDEEMDRIAATGNGAEAETLTACMMDPYARSR